MKSLLRRFACWILDITETENTIDEATQWYEEPTVRVNESTTWIIAYLSDIPGDPFHQIVRLRGVFGNEITAIRVMNSCKINPKYAICMSVEQFVSKLTKAYAEKGVSSVYQFKADQ